MILFSISIKDGVYKIIYDGKVHKISAVVSADNYRGEKEFTVHVYKQTVKPQQPTEPEAPDGDTPKVDAVPIAIGVGAGAVSVIGLIIYFIVRRRRIL